MIFVRVEEAYAREKEFQRRFFRLKQLRHATFPIDENNRQLNFGDACSMGYDVHITRAKWHFENDGQWITDDEWLTYVEQDPELRLAGYNGKYFALWIGKSEYPYPWLDWQYGNIYSKNPDDAIIDKMVTIAKALGAKVQGDDGEVNVGGGRANYLPPPED